MNLFRGGPQPTVRPAKDDDEEKQIEIEQAEEYVVAALGYEGDDAIDRMWETWTKYGAAGVVPESAEQQAQRYAGVPDDSVELQPGLAKYQFRDTDVLLTCSLDYLIRTWDAATCKPLQIFEGHTNFVNAVEPYHGEFLVSASDDFSLRLWKRGSSEYGELVRTIWCGYLGLKSVCVLPGHRVACGSQDFLLRIVSILTGEVLHKTEDHYNIGPYDNFWQEEGCGAVFSILHIRNNIMATVADDTTIRFWDFDTMRCLGIHVGHMGYGDDLGSKDFFVQRFAPVWKVIHLGADGSKIASGSYDRTIVIWDIADVENVHIERTLRGHDNSVVSMCVLAESILLSCSGDETCKIWNWQTGECLRTLATRGYPTCATRMTDSTVAIGGGDATIRIYDWKKGEDLMGENGFYAHEFSLTGMAQIFQTNLDEKRLEPIMYRSTEPARTAWEQTYAPEHQKAMVTEALRLQALKNF